MVRYQRNNILFRIAAAAAISKFKSIQAHSFGQLNRKELDFDTSAREVVLLTYDRFSQWIYRVERICLSAATCDKDAKYVISSLIASFADELHVTQTVIESHPDIFKNNVDSYMRKIHDYASRIIDQHLETLEGKKIDEIYTGVVEITSKYLQHILVAMHEFNNNCVTNKEPAFVSIADFCLDATQPETRLIPCAERMRFFNQFSQHSQFMLKYYGSDEQAREDAYKELKEHCNRLNITLVKEEMSIVQEE